MAESVSFIHKRGIEWKVKHIFSMKRFESEVFSFCGSRWCFTLMKVRRKTKFNIRIYLDKRDSIETLLSEFRTSAYIRDKYNKAQFLFEESVWSSGSCVWESDFEDLREKEDSFLTDDVVTFVFDLTPETVPDDMSGKEVKPSNNSSQQASNNVSYQAAVKVETDPSMESLTLDLRHLLDDGTHSDVTLKCGETAMPAHSCILSARSKVFAAMLGSDMIESRNGVIEISDMEPPALNQLLQFIYSGKLSDLSLNTAPQLYAAGDKYDIESLKRRCSDCLQKNLTVVNACDILTLADAHSDGVLKECTVTFILDAQLMKNDGIWLKFCDHHPKLAIEILNRAYKKHAI